MRVVDLEVDHAREAAPQRGIIGVEALLDEFGVGVVFREYDGFAELVAVLHMLAARHQVFQHLVHRVGIEQPFVDRLRFHAIGRAVLLAPFGGVPGFLVLVGQLVVADAFAGEFQRHRDGAHGHQVAIPHRLLQRIGVGRDAAFQFEQAVGVAVDFVLGGCGQADQQAVEPIEDGAVFAIDRAVGFVNDEKVEVADAEATLGAVLILDQRHHGGVGGDEHAAFGGFVGDQVYGGGGWQVGLEGADGLVHQGDAIGEEQHALGPVAAHQQIDQRDHGAGFAGAGCHHHQGAALVLGFEGFGDAADGAVLIDALDDIGIRRGIGEGAAAGAALDQERQFGLFVEALHFAWGAARVVPDPVLVAVGAEDHRALAEG